jgi:transcriptional regulator with XRE-family HTH domain
VKALRRLREKAGLTQYVVARKSGVTRMRLSLAESGQLRLSPAEEAAVREAIRQGIEEQAVRLQHLLANKETKTSATRSGQGRGSWFTSSNLSR